MFEYIGAAISNIYRKRFRSLLTMMGISIGVCAVVIIGAVGNIGTELLDKEISTFGIGGITIGTDDRISETRLYTDDLEIIANDSKVDKAVPILLEYTKSYCRNLVINTAVWGVGSGADQIFSLELLHGRLINYSDLAGAERVCIVDEEYAKKTFKRSNIVGKKVTLELDGRSEPLEVIGVVKSGGVIVQNLVTDIIPSFIYSPYTTLQSLGGKSYFDQICVVADDEFDEEVVATSIIRLLEEKNNNKGSYKSENVTAQKDKLNGIVDIVTIILSIIAGISLIVAGLSVMTVMLVSVKERTKEIGIKKSIGATKKNIMIEFIIEAFVLTLFGSLTGCIIAIAMTFVACAVFGLSPSINWGLTLFCIGFSLVIGIVFGVYPAIKASKLSPVDALRYE